FYYGHWVAGGKGEWFVEFGKSSNRIFGRPHPAFTDASNVTSRLVCGKTQHVLALRLRSYCRIGRHSALPFCSGCIVMQSKTRMRERLSLRRRKYLIQFSVE